MPGEPTPVLRAAVLFEYPSLNGGEFSWLAALPALRAANIEIVAIAPPTGSLADRLHEEGIRIKPWITDLPARSHTIAKSDTPPTTETTANMARLSQPARRTRLESILKDVAPDIVHANSLAMSRLLGPVSRQLSIPSLGHIRDIVRLSRKAIDDLNQLDRLLAVSHATRDWHIDSGLKATKVHVQYNGVDLERFRPHNPSDRNDQGRGTWQRKLRLDPATRLIGNMGQLGLRKGTEKVLESAALLAEDFPDVHWVIAGERHSEKDETIAYERRLHQLAQSPPLLGRVHFVGRVADSAAWMRDLSLLVHTARQEPLGRVLLEGSATGLPMVATDVGGTAEILEAAAKLVPVDDVAGIAAAIRELLSDPAGCAAIGQKARQRAVSRFDQRLRGPELTEHYCSVATVA